MKILDLDMDYFMDSVAHTPDSVLERLSEADYGDCVWSERRVRSFLEENLGLSKERKLPGRIVCGHNEALIFWRELIAHGELTVPFDVIHVDSHADLGLGYSSWTHILNYLLSYPVEERPMHNKYIDCFGNLREESIGDYLLFAVAYRWISKIIQKLARLLIEDGLFHTIVLKRKRQKKRKEKIAAATYLYQADSDGEWGEIQFDFENKTAEIIRLADWDKMISQPFAKYAISYLLNCQNKKLPKETVISFEE